jgi:hypothetical protein
MMGTQNEVNKEKPPTSLDARGYIYNSNLGISQKGMSSSKLSKLRPWPDDDAGAAGADFAGAR